MHPRSLLNFYYQGRTESACCGSCRMGAGANSVGSLQCWEVTVCYYPTSSSVCRHQNLTSGYRDDLNRSTHSFQQSLDCLMFATYAVARSCTNNKLKNGAIGNMWHQHKQQDTTPASATAELLLPLLLVLAPCLHVLTLEPPAKSPCPEHTLSDGSMLPP